MSDGLSAFFAKKKDKKKKKTAVKIEEVGQVLERRAKRQEEYEQEHEEQAEKRVEEERTQSNTEESEWIEYGDNNQGRLEGLKIKDMGLENEDDQVNNEEPEDREVHETKTWGQISSEKKNANEETEQAVTISDKAMAAAYKPPSRRIGGAPSGYRKAAPANFDMSSDAAFPSLADASKIEKVKKEESKTASGWAKVGSGPSSGPAPSTRSYATTSGSGREAALAAAKILGSSGPSATTRSEATPSPPPAAAPVAPAAPAAPKAGSYVPPHLRNRTPA